MAGKWEWDDIRFFLAASREGSFSGAARALGVDHVTVGRRIASLEEQLGAKLLTRTPDGLNATTAGQAIIRQSEAMETSALDIERMVAGHDAQYEARIRVTTTEVLASEILVPEIARLREKYSQLQVEIVTGIRLLDIARREADIAVRPVRPTSPNLICRRVGELGFALYASRAYLARHGTPARGRGLRGHHLITYVGTPSPDFGPLFMRESVEGATIALRSNDRNVHARGAAEGLGICELSCIFGDRQRELVRIWPHEKPMLRPIWMVIHEDLRKAARIRLLSNAIAEGFERKAKLLRLGYESRGRKKSP
jgi:DNA-binding transcriptional LysR family regulator